MVYRATAVYTLHNTYAASKAVKIFDNYDDAFDWLDSQANEYAISTGLDDFYANGSKIEELGK